MTVEELYEYAVEHNAEDYDIIVKDLTGNRKLTIDAELDAEIDHEHHYVEM